MRHADGNGAKNSRTNSKCWFSGCKVTIFSEKSIKEAPKKRMFLGYLKRNVYFCSPKRENK
jgi:hypothetical protein